MANPMLVMSASHASPQTIPYIHLNQCHFSYQHPNIPFSIHINITILFLYTFHRIFLYHQYFVYILAIRNKSLHLCPTHVSMVFTVSLISSFLSTPLITLITLNVHLFLVQNSYVLSYSSVFSFFLARLVTY